MNGKVEIKRLGLILTVFLLLGFGALVLGQDTQGNREKQLREEILSIYRFKGEEGLKAFAKNQKDRISNKFIVDFSEVSLKEGKEEWLNASEILAKERKDAKTLADVHLKMGKFFMKFSDYKQASNYLDEAIKVYFELNDLVGQGNVYFNKGEIHLFIGNISNADEMYNKARQLFENKGEKQGQGNVYRGKGDICVRIGNYSSANEMYDKAFDFFKQTNDFPGQGNVIRNKGDIYLIYGNYQMANEMYDKALFFFKKSKDIRGQGNVYWSKGEMLFRSSQYPAALSMYEKALFFFRELKDPQPRAYVYWRKGNISFYSGDNSKALEKYEKALSLLKKSGEPVGQGNVLYSTGDVYLYTGRYDKALKMYEKALHFYKKGREPRGQGNIYCRKGQIHFLMGETSNADMMFDEAFTFFEKTGALLGQGNVFMNKGDIYLRKGYNFKTLEMYNKALLLFKKAGSLLDQGNIYHFKGQIFVRVGDYPKALEMYEKAVKIFKKINNPMGLANSYLEMGNICQINNQNSEALEMFGKALHLYKEMEFQIGIGNVYRNKGEIYQKTANYSKALNMYDKATSFFEKAKEPLGLGCIYKNKGIILFLNGKSSMALDYFEKAIRIFNKICEFELEALTIQKKAMALTKQGKKGEAFRLFQEAILKSEKIRNFTALSEMKRVFMEKTHVQYEETVLFLLKNKYYDKSFYYTESMLARVFLDQMIEGMAKLEKGLKVELKEERDNIVGKLSAFSRQMQETGGKDEKRLEELKEEYRRVESEFEDLRIKIRLENPLYASVNYPQPVSVQDLQRDVLKKDETLLSYFISEEKSYAFVVSKDSFEVKPLKVKGNELKALIDRYLSAIKENNIDDMKRFGNLLYKKLFEPLENYLDKNNDIIIVPMGELETIPFESFVVDKKKTGRPVFLLEKYRLKYVQGATLLSILRKHYNRENTSNSFIGFGDPVYDYENFTKEKPEQGSITRTDEEENSIENEIKEIHRDRYARAGGILDRLPQSGEEIQTIARLFEKKSLKNVAHLREQATEENAKAAGMKDFGYIHFSCHGLLNDEFQSLVLSQLSPDKSKEDGYLTLNEIMNCDYNARLVVLSACETGKGKMYKGEGVTGLTRAVMYAGTPAVVASLWKVDDTASGELMIHFYQNILEKSMDKVEALRQAKLELINSQTFASPYYWSGFIMYGE